MNKKLKTLFVVVGITVSTLASAGTVLDSRSYPGSVGSCKAVAQWAWVNGMVRPEMAQRLSQQIDARYRLLKGQDLTDAVSAFNRANDLLPKAKAFDIHDDNTKCVMWVNNIQ